MVSSKYAHNRSRAKTPPHCKPSPPVGDIPAPPPPVALGCTWSTMWPGPIAYYHWPALELTKIVTSRWWYVDWHREPAWLHAHVQWRPNPGRFCVYAKLFPPFSFSRFAAGSKPGPPPKERFTLLELMLVPQYVNDSVFIAVQW